MLFADPRFKALIQQLEAQADLLNPRSQSMVMAALSRLDYNPPPGFLDRMREAIERRLGEGQFDPRSLTHVISSFVKFKYATGHIFLDQFAEVGILVASILRDVTYHVMAGGV